MFKTKTNLSSSIYLQPGARIMYFNNSLIKHEIYKKKFNSLTFESALTLLNEHKVIDKDFQENVKQKVDYFREKSKVLNTERSTKNWIKKFNDFQKDYGYLIPLSKLSDIKQLEKELVKYISIMKKNDGKEYKANSIKQAVDVIDRYLRIHSPLILIYMTNICFQI
ncbi:hypothetical protein Glove_121g39 [Diversispora epigaea]|uniref:Uncharacterized protein n=1 Tax=Diversispora epigaea TaxID=1348612 RepID=A0A397J976_9GLOM|nr:hypothetical protein Glove_121g39 [Diversispora epigaea]